jgi:hypothetical protein
LSVGSPNPLIVHLTRQVAFCLKRFDEARRRHLAALRGQATAQRVLPTAKGQTGLTDAKRAVGQPGASSKGKAIGAVADGDDRLGPDEQAREPEGMIIFAGTGATPCPRPRPPGAGAAVEARRADRAGLDRLS